MSKLPSVTCTQPPPYIQVLKDNIESIQKDWRAFVACDRRRLEGKLKRILVDFSVFVIVRYDLDHVIRQMYVPESYREYIKADIHKYLMCELGV